MTLTQQPGVPGQSRQRSRRVPDCAEAHQIFRCHVAFAIQQKALIDLGHAMQLCLSDGHGERWRARKH